MTAWLLPTLMTAAKTGMDIYAAKKYKTPKFGKTSYGRFLKQIGERGTYSPLAQSTILSRASGAAGNIAASEKADIRGYLESRGMGNSIAGVRALSEPGQRAIESVSNTASDLTTQNEASKVSALEAFARGETQANEARRLESKHLLSNIFGNVTSGVQGVQEGMKLDKIKPIFEQAMKNVDEMINAGDDEGAEALMSKLMMILQSGILPG